MAGLLDTLALGTRSMQTYRKAIDVAGHNLANVSTPGYTRQRAAIEAATTTDEFGQSGAGSDVVQVVRLRNAFLERQLSSEASNAGALEVTEDTLRQAMNALQETVNRNDLNGTSTAGISQKLSEFFSSLQSLSTNPTSISERQAVLEKARALGAAFNRVDQRLGQIAGDLDQHLAGDLGRANSILGEIARLNEKISNEEAFSAGEANNLRDTRQLKLQELSRLIKVDAVEQENGSLTISAAGTLLVEGNVTVAALESFDSGNGKLLIRATGTAEPLNLTGGTLRGIVTVRDEQIAPLRANINSLAAAFITQVNDLHSGGFSLTGSSGSNLFTGSGATNIAVNPEILSNPALFQGSGAAGEPGNNTLILALSRLSNQAQEALGGLSFSEKQTQLVTDLGQQLATATRDLQDQEKISAFVQRQRDSVSAVSVDEEMANLVTFQKAFQASAKLISMVDEMLATIIEM